MPLDSFAASSADITGDADFDRNLALRQFFNEFGILGRCESVADALGLQIQCSPDRFWPNAFSGMSGEMQSMIGGSGKSIFEEFGRTLLLIAADPECNH